MFLLHAFKDNPLLKDKFQGQQTTKTFPVVCSHYCCASSEPGKSLLTLSQQGGESLVREKHSLAKQPGGSSPCFPLQSVPPRLLCKSKALSKQENYAGIGKMHNCVLSRKKKSILDVWVNYNSLSNSPCRTKKDQFSETNQCSSEPTQRDGL